MEDAFDIILCEKDQQAENIASALGLSTYALSITIPTKESLKIDQRLATVEARIIQKKAKITEMEKKYSDINDLRKLKKYQELIESFSQIQQTYNQLIADKEAIQLEESQITIYKSDQNKIILLACSGHLINISFDTSKDEDDEEDEYDDDLKFKTKFKPPLPFNSMRDLASQAKWIKLSAIQYFISNVQVKRFICATDYDREGQSIFGTIMEYLQINLEQCWRMKFSTLENEVLQNAYNNLIPFDIKLYQAGAMRRWMDYIIGFNLSPSFSHIYRNTMRTYLESLDIEESYIKQCLQGSFHIGRVKLVILAYIYQHTIDQLYIASDIKKSDQEIKRKQYWQLTYNDNSGIFVEVVKSYESVFDNTSFDFTKQCILKIENVETFNSSDVSIPCHNHCFVPSFLNLTKVFQICEKIGASTEQISRILEYLYLQKFISYPRSKSEQWEIPDEASKKKYAHSVLNSLKECGYPVENYYYDSCGNEGNKTHSHPCIHPLPSLCAEKIAHLKDSNPLGYLVLNEIIVYTLKCFEKMPVIKVQRIHYALYQDSQAIAFYSDRYIEIIEANILSFDGIDSSQDIEPMIQVSKGDDVFILPDKREEILAKIVPNRSELEELNDFDIINYLNENDIGTDATRSLILNELIKLQYISSSSVLLTTYLGNILSRLASEYVEFIDEQYTINMEESLNKIESGELSCDDFMKDIKDIIQNTYNNILTNEEDIGRIFMEAPICENHNTQMVLRKGMYGMFLQCPHYYTDEKCNQKVSL